MSEAMSGGFEVSREITTPPYEGVEDVQWIFISQLPEGSTQPGLDVGVIAPGTAHRYLPPNYRGLDKVEVIIFVREVGPCLGYNRTEWAAFCQGASEGDFDALLERPDDPQAS